MKHPRTSSQFGQAIIWFLATLAACCALLMIVYNVGQVSAEKERTTNAADAVALSAGLVQARGMNMLAYNNRAIIANEMTIAQAASLDAWFEYNVQLTQNLALITSWIPYVDAVTQTIADVMSQIGSVVYQAARGITQGFQLAVDVLEGQRKILAPAIPVAVQQMATEVADKNNVAMNDNMAFSTLSFAKLFVDNQGFYVDHAKSGNNGNDDRKAANDVILSSRDQFTANRGPGKIIDGLNSALSFVPGITAQLVKSSGSAKLPDFDHWEAQDSLELDAQACLFGLCVSLPVSGPVGWGRANTNNDGSQGQDWAYSGNCNGYGIGSACWLADVWNPDNIPGWNGVPDMLDVKDRNKELHFFVSVKSKDGNLPMTSERMGIANVDLPGPQGSPRVTDNLAKVNGKAELQAISSARIFFKRPKRDSADHTGTDLFRADQVQEYASLYNPYWQARLHTPNCKVLAFGEDCIARGLLYTGLGEPGAELAVDLVLQ